MKKYILRYVGVMVLLVLIAEASVFAQKKGTDIGQIAPEIKMKDPNGKTIALTDLRGQMVLIDFWASWCGPCRRENPTVVKAYNQYKNQTFKEGKGFTVYSVSLDKNASAWVKGIEEDQLSWPYHVCDFGGWQSRPAAMYNVRGIPANFLINADGIIVAKNLRGPTLEAKLKELAQ